MSVAFTREESAETAAEVELPDRPISPPEFGDGVGTGGVGQRDGGMARRLQRRAAD